MRRLISQYSFVDDDCRVDAWDIQVRVADKSSSVVPYGRSRNAVLIRRSGWIWVPPFPSIGQRGEKHRLT